MSIDELKATSQWQPIASAPKQGRILVYNPMVGVYSSEFVQEYVYEPWKTTIEKDRLTFEGYPLGLWNGELGKWYCEATLWMPLPSPPIT